MIRKLSVMALETPARDQPVASVIGFRKTASDIMAPTATQPISAPIATTTQPYLTFIPYLLDLAPSPYSRSASRQIDIAIGIHHGGATRCRSRYGPWEPGRAMGTCPKGRPVRAHRLSRCGRRRP